MSRRWFWVLAAFLISTGVYSTIRYGLRPKPIPVLNATEFKDLEQVGIVIYKRLRQNIRSERVVLLGSNAEVKNDQEIWKGLLDAATADREQVVYLRRSDLPELNLTKNLETTSFSEEDIQRGTLFETVRSHVRAGRLIVIHGLTTQTSHLVRNSLSHQIDKLIGHPVLSISTLRLAFSTAEMDELQTQCLDATEDRDGLRRLGCAAQRVARKNQKKKLAADRIWAVMERHGLKEYLLFIHQP